MNKKAEYRELVVYPHPQLTSQSLPVRKINQDVCDKLDEMTQIMLNYYGIGLAAPQIGISKRLIVVQLNKILYQVINPKISWQCNGSKCETEGCLSFPEQFYKVNRAEEVVLEGIDPNKKEITVLANGLLARVFQHEIDHLDGILINSIGIFVSSDNDNYEKL